MALMPTCSTCGQPHWRFSACAEAPALAAKEIADARERERLKVIPQPKHDPPQQRKFTSDRYVQVAPGKYARKER